MATAPQKPSPFTIGLSVSGIVLIGEMVVHRALNLNGVVGAILVGLIGGAAALALAHHGSAGEATRAVADKAQTATELDQVSGVLSLRNLTIAMLESMAIAERYGRELAIVKIDIDDFDLLQSRFGADGIDAAVKLVGDTLNNALRVPDRVGRYAPHSFLVVLPETAANGAMQIAERVRRLIAKEDVHASSGERFSVTLSAGVANFSAGDDPQRLIERAEVGLSEAKSDGGDSTVISGGRNKMAPSADSGPHT